MTSLSRLPSDSTSSDLVSLASDSSTSPNVTSIVSTLQQRFRSDLPYTRLSSTHLIVLNPLKSLASSSEASADDYRKQTYGDTNWEAEGRPPPDSALAPHPYELAGRVYHMMRRTGSSQAVVYDGATGSGKTSTAQLFTSQLLRLASAASKKEHKMAEQLRSLDVLLNSFGCAQTTATSNASRFSRYLELHFDTAGRLGAAQALTFGLDKSRVNALAPGERTFLVFYQLLAGATQEERDLFKLDDVTAYNLLASSGCYRLAGGPSTDDSVGMGALRAAMKTLGFKDKHSQAVFSFLSAILLLGNIEFGDHAGSSLSLGAEPAQITNPDVLEDVAEMLGIDPEDLSQALTNRSRFIRKESVASVLDSAGARAQRDSLMRDLYATLFAFVVETANHKLAPADEAAYATKIVQLDLPGFQKSKDASDGFANFAINSTAECSRNWLSRHDFDDSIGPNAALAREGIRLPEVERSDDDNRCVEMLRGGAVGSEVTDRDPIGLYGYLASAVDDVLLGEAREEDDAPFLQRADRMAPFTPSYISSTKAQPQSKSPATFAVNHYAGQSTYDASGFISREMDAFDTTFLQMLRHSQVSFVARLFAGPSLATVSHPYDPSSIVGAQVSVRPLRRPSPLSNRSADLPLLDPLKPYGITRQLNSSLSEILRTVDQSGQLWPVLCIRPNDISQPGSFDTRSVQAQVAAMALPDLVGRKKVNYVQGLSYANFCERYHDSVEPAAAAVGGLTEPSEKIQAFVIASGWREATDYAFGASKIWLTYGVWRRMEDRLRRSEVSDPSPTPKPALASPYGDHAASSSASVSYLPSLSRDQSLLMPNVFAEQSTVAAASETDSMLHRRSSEAASRDPFSNVANGDYDRSLAGDQLESRSLYANEWSDKRAYGDINALFAEKADDGVPRAIDAVEEIPTTSIRRWWVRFTWLCTWYIPTSLMTKWGGMKRPDVQMAWREKVTICTMIFFLCGTILFYILAFGRLLCPDSDRAWNTDELATHASSDDYYVAIAGTVYDLSKFVKRQHSDTSTEVTEDVMLELGGLDLTPYFPVPMTLACPGLVTSDSFTLQVNSNLTATYTQAIHTSGYLQTDTSSALANSTWYTGTLQPFLKQHWKGYFVFSDSDLSEQSTWRSWAAIDSKVYDLTNYLDTVDTATSGTLANQNVNFLDSSIVELFDQSPGGDITSDFNKVISSMNTTYREQNLNCLNNAFYIGKTDFRDSARCLVQNYLLLAFSVILVATILSKFIAALQLTPKRNPEQQNKFVICQVTCYTEGEEELRKTIDSIAGQKYDDKRKLIFVICDGMIIGSGNELPTPRIVLDILGVESKVDPEPLMFKSIAEGSKQLNYGKVYSGLYEYNGHIVPYIVVVKVGRPSERVRPGNRGKRDTQILMMRYLNRVHFDAPMYPLELEINHQMKNVIGIDPTFYEYVLMVDADTRVESDGLNRLVAVAADDSRIIAICGETTLDNEHGSWWTMIQVYEYYISHHLAKAFESLFGSVTCLPGCFSMYRLRSADKGRPMFISNRIIDEYSENRVDTLHKKNLFALGEDRYLTTLILKHFPTFRTKFTADAKAHTAAPDRFSVLLSQRRRWINSTVHNLAELLLMPELCGFCLFSMRFIVFIDLLGTVILPATVIYLLYLIITASTGTSAFPLISIIMIAAVYGLQMIIFLFKRQWQYIGWMIIYLLAFPIYSFFLPVYSFWHMDDFSWGNTRIVVGEKGNKKIIAGTDDEPYDDSMIPLKRFSDYQREVWDGGYSGTAGDMPRDGDSFDSLRLQQGAFYAPGLNGSMMFQGAHTGRAASPSGYPGYQSPFESPLREPSRAGSMYKSPSYAGSATGASERASGDYFQSTNLLEKPRYSRSSSFAFNDGPRSRSPLTSFGGPLNSSASQLNMAMPGPMPRAPSQMSMGGGMPLLPHMNSMQGMPSPAFGIQYPSMYGFPAAAAAGGGGFPASGSGMLPSHSMDMLNRQSSGMALAAQYTGGSAFNPRFSTMTGSGGGGMANPFASTQNLGSSTPDIVLPVSQSADPSEEELKSAIVSFLGAQADLYSVTKRNVRTAVEESFVNADVKGKKALVNRLIDEVLEGKS